MDEQAWVVGIDVSKGRLDVAAAGTVFQVANDAAGWKTLVDQLSKQPVRAIGLEPSVGYEAFDLRLGAELGTTLFEIFRPYIPVRVFGGPVYWRYQGAAVTGTDTHHYQVGAGFNARLSRRMALFAEGIPLGERAVSFGVAAVL